MQRVGIGEDLGVGGALGYSGQTGFDGASERSESESEGRAVEPRYGEVEKVGKTGLSVASERSSSVSQRGFFEWRVVTATVVLACG